MTSPADIMVDPGTPVAACPLFSETLPTRWAGLPWNTPQNAPALIDAKLRLGEEAGFTPIVKTEVGCLGLLEPRKRVLEESGGKRTVAIRYDTPHGPLEAIAEQGEHGSHGIQPLISSPDDTLRMVAAWEQLADWPTFRARLAAIVEQVAGRGHVALNIGHPFGSFEDHVTTIFYAMEHPDQMRQAADRHCQVKLRMIDEAAALGVRIFFFGGLGSNMYSPAMVDEWMVPYCILMRERIHHHGGIYYQHECGSMKHKLARGVYTRLMPDWLEGFEEPPLGDLDSFAAVRRQLPPEIVFKGNLNLEFLANHTPNEIEERTLAMLDELAGYRHLVGGACSLLAETPIPNLQAMVRATNRYLGRTS